MSAPHSATEEASTASRRSTKSCPACMRRTIDALVIPEPCQVVDTVDSHARRSDEAALTRATVQSPQSTVCHSGQTRFGWRNGAASNLPLLLQFCRYTIPVPTCRAARRLGAANAGRQPSSRDSLFTAFAAALARTRATAVRYGPYLLCQMGTPRRRIPNNNKSHCRADLV